MTHRRALLAAAALLGAATAGPAMAATHHPKQAKVDVGSDYYSPGKDTIRVGERVRFTWVSDSFDLHDVRVRKGPEKFKSPLKSAGTWSHRFAKPGKYVLYCSQHADMTMKLTVKRR